MPHASQVRSAIDRTDAAIALVERVATDDAEHQQVAAALVVKHWESAPWPYGLLAQTLFVSTDGASLLVYGQWASEEALAERLARPTAAERPDWRAIGIAPAEPRAYQLYRRVAPTTLPHPPPTPLCFPAAFFAMPDRDAARGWVDGLLANEERKEGEDRAYPGALAANFHVAADGGGIFLLSEWASDAEAVDHIHEVIEPLLEHMGQAEAGPGSRYGFHATVHAS